METEISRIAKTLEYNWDGPMWHGTNLKEVLSGITAELAFRKPGAGSHNIYELVAHLICWRRFVLEQLKGNAGYTVEINSATDWPGSYATNEESWQQLLDELEETQTELLALISGFKEEMLDEMVPGRKFSWYVLLHGVISHDIYHSGQISILKKQPE
ncbi:MAG TPA: DinB family protein [Chitinophagales bacterium]|nr:DinB family protein [Chitinophagales bacterium]